jgi:arabinan endo-1,5-alpha-L-arabinosidase
MLKKFFGKHKSNKNGIVDENIGILKSGLYRNPVINHDFPDPSIIYGNDDYYYVYGTQYVSLDKVINIQSAKSRDLIHWELLADAMPTKPKWANITQNFWAPDVSIYKGVYYMYFSAETNDRKGMGIGVALSLKPEGPFVDSGKPLISGESYINIDPAAFEDPKSGKRFLFWGSGFHPIRAQELAENGLDFALGTEPVIVLPEDPHVYDETLVEGVYLIYRHGYYYMFYSGDGCFLDHRYAIMVARSKHLLGPYEKLSCNNPKPNNIILHYNHRWLAPGHNSIVTDFEENDWIVYHAIDSVDQFIPGSDVRQRKMFIDRIYYEDGWPRTANSTPSVDVKESPVVF